MAQPNGGHPGIADQRAYQHLVKRPRGFRMLLGILARVVLAAGFITVFVMMGTSVVDRLGWSLGLTGHAGRYEPTHCSDEYYENIQKYQDTVCFGTLSAPDGRVVRTDAKVILDHSVPVGHSIDARYSDNGAIHLTATREMLWISSVSLLSLAVGGMGVFWLALAFFRWWPTHPWFVPGSTGRRRLTRLAAVIPVCTILGLFFWISTMFF